VSLNGPDTRINPKPRQGGSTQPITLEALSNRIFTLLKPEIGVLPVVLKTKSCPSIRVTLPRASRAASDNATACAAPFFMRDPGQAQVVISCEISLYFIAATSSRRMRQSISTRMKGPYGSSTPHAAFQILPISS